MVKSAFLDREMSERLNLTSANSINISRLVPQSFYYFEAARQFENAPVFVIPSGNFGNLTAGLLAEKMGLKVKHFVAATNANDVVPAYLESGKYEARESVATISNAMDVGDPSNFIRIRHLHNDNLDALNENLSSYSFTDEQTKKAMVQIHKISNYIADPHGAVGYLGLKQYQKLHTNTYGVFLETAHPVKFLDVVEDTLGTTLEIPSQIQKVMGKEKKSIKINTYGELKAYLINRH
jgi:threonine synthase